MLMIAYIVLIYFEYKILKQIEKNLSEKLFFYIVLQTIIFLVYYLLTKTLFFSVF